MDKELETIISLAKQRGSKFIKKGSSPEEFPGYMAELGIYLLCEHDKLGDKEGKGYTLQYLNDLHQKIDRFRQEIFELKRKAVE